MSPHLQHVFPARGRHAMARLLGFIVVLCCFSACASIPLPPPTCKLKFYQALPELAAPGSVGIKAAFVALPNEEKREANAPEERDKLYSFQIAGDASSDLDPTGLSDAQIFDRYGEAVRRDMEAAARASGMQMVGPFKTRSELVYAQKEALDFVIIPAGLPEGFEFEIEEARTALSGELSGEQAAGYWLKFLLAPKAEEASLSELKAMRISGRIRIPTTSSLWVIEPLSGEKLLVEPLAQVSEFVPFTPAHAVLGRKVGNTLYLTKGSLDALNDDPEVSNLRCELLNKQYQAVAANLSRVLDPKGLKTLLPQSKALKARVVYTSQGVPLAK